MFRNLFLIAVISLAGLLGESKAAEAANHYALVGIDNPTNTTLVYHFKWGADSEWKTYTLAPGYRRWHSWEYEFPNENLSPTPYIRFDSDLSSGVLWEEFKLHAYAAPYESFDLAKKYFFRRLAGGLYVDFFAR